MKAVRFVVATAGWRRIARSMSGSAVRASTRRKSATNSSPPPMRPTFAGEPQPQASASETPSRIAPSATDRSAAPSQSIRGRWPEGSGGMS